MINWIRRRRRHSYNDLWHMVYGGSHEGDKGLLREYDFLLEIGGGWKQHAELLMKILENVRALHKPAYRNSWMEAEAGGEYCSSCKSEMYPCSTIKLLNGE